MSRSKARRESEIGRRDRSRRSRSKEQGRGRSRMSR